MTACGRPDRLPVITTRRLLLRELSPQDAPALYVLARDGRVSRWLTWQPPADEEEMRRRIDVLLQERGGGRGADFTVLLRETGEVLGIGSLFSVEPSTGTCEAGYWLGVPYWGRGIGTELLAALKELAGGPFGVSRLVTRCAARNRASARVMEHCGLTYRQTRLCHIYTKHRWWRLKEYSCLL